MADLCSHMGCNDREYDVRYEWCELTEQCEILKMYTDAEYRESFDEVYYIRCIMRIFSLYTGREMNDPYAPLQLREDRSGSVQIVPEEEPYASSLEAF